MSLLTNLTASWQLDEASGNRSDSHGSNTLTDFGSIGSGAYYSWTAAVFTGGQTLAILNPTALDVGSDTDFSFSINVVFTNLASYRIIMDRNGPGATGDVPSGNTQICYRIYYDAPSGKIVFTVGNGSSYQEVATSFVVGTGQVYHIVAWHDSAADQICLWVNGYTTSASWSGGTQAGLSGGYFRLGDQGDGLYTFQGYMSRCSFWNGRVITLAERAALLNSLYSLSYTRYADPPTGGLLTGLLSYYKSDESSGVLVDTHGPVDLPIGATPGTTTGKINTSRSYVGASINHAYSMYTPQYSFGNSDFTIQAWVRLASKPGYCAVLGRWEISNQEFLLYYVASTDRFYFTVSSNGTNQIDLIANNSGALSTGTWYLIHAWHDSVNDVLGISVNAGTPDTTSHSAGLYQGGAVFIFGINQAEVTGTRGGWDGDIDEAALWSRVLSSTDRTNLYNSGAGLAYPLTVSVPASGRIPIFGWINNPVAA